MWWVTSKESSISDLRITFLGVQAETSSPTRGHGTTSPVGTLTGRFRCHCLSTGCDCQRPKITEMGRPDLAPARCSGLNVFLIFHILTIWQSPLFSIGKIIHKYGHFQYPWLFYQMAVHLWKIHRPACTWEATNNHGAISSTAADRGMGDDPSSKQSSSSRSRASEFKSSRKFSLRLSITCNSSLRYQLPTGCAKAISRFSSDIHGFSHVFPTRQHQSRLSKLGSCSSPLHGSDTRNPIAAAYAGGPVTHVFAEKLSEKSAEQLHHSIFLTKTGSFGAKVHTWSPSISPLSHHNWLLVTWLAWKWHQKIKFRLPWLPLWPFSIVFWTATCHQLPCESMDGRMPRREPGKVVANFYLKMLGWKAW